MVSSITKVAGSATDIGQDWPFNPYSITQASWVNPANAQGSADGTVATTLTGLWRNGLGRVLDSAGLQFNNFDFSSLPANQAIVGVLAEVLAANAAADDPSTAMVSTIRIHPSGTSSAIRYGTVLFNKGGTLAWAAFGGSTDSWGLTLDSADIDNDNFGFTLTAQASAVFGGTPYPTCRIDSARVTVWYEDISVVGTPTVDYRGLSRTGPGNALWRLHFIGSGAVNRYQVRTAATSGAGTQVSTGAAVAGANAIDIAYDAAGLVDGSQTLYLFVSADGGATWPVASTSITLVRDDTAPTAATSISTTPSTVPLGAQYTLSFIPHDGASTGTLEMGWQIWTGTGATGILLGNGACTSGAALTTGALTDASLEAGSNTRYLRTRDGAGNWTETSFTVTGATPLSVTVDAPPSGGSITYLPYVASWSYTGSSQSDYRLVIYATDGVTVVHDSGWVASANKSATIPVGVQMVHNTGYLIQVSIHTTDTPAEFGISAQQTFTYSLTPPETLANLGFTAQGE